MKPNALALATILVLTAAIPGCLNDVLGRSNTDPLDYLRDSDYTKWTIEVDYTAGERPAQSVLDFVRGRIAPLVNKPDGIEFVLDDALTGSDKTWTTQNLQDLSKDYRDIKTNGKTVSTHLLFVDGSFKSSDGEGGSTLGVAIGWDLIVIFVDAIKDSCTVQSLCTFSDNRIIEVVTTHEFGHILGLVNRKDGSGNAPVPMVRDHEDNDHEAHSNNRNSVMYWAVDSSAFTQVLQGDLPDSFDADDKADLKAAGGR